MRCTACGGAPARPGHSLPLRSGFSGDAACAGQPLQASHAADKAGAVPVIAFGLSSSAPSSLLCAAIWSWGCSRGRSRRRHRRIGANTQEADVQAVPTAPPEWPFHVVQCGGRGLGAVASRDISCGELIISEKPLLTFRDDASWLSDVKQQFDKLTHPDKDAISSLCDAQLVDGKASLQGIIGTNSVGTVSESFDGVVCKMISRFNHSCVPNCEQTWDDAIGEERIFASKDIKKGEELCFCYLDPFLPKAERSQMLFPSYRFVCDCQACSMEGDEMRESDDRRRELRDLLRELSGSVSDDDDQSKFTAERFLKLCDEEGLLMNGFRVQAYYHAFQSLLLAGHQEEARDWIQQAASHCEMCRGAKHQEALQLRGYAEDPSSHPAASEEPPLWTGPGFWAGAAALIGTAAVAFLSVPR